MPNRLIPFLLIVGLMTGCDFGSSKSAQRFVEIQAEQNRQMGELQQQVQAQQAALNEQRDALESQRQQIAHRRVQAPLVADALLVVGTLLGCLIPVVLAWALLHRGDQELESEIIAETLLHDLNQGPSSVLIPALGLPPAETAPRLTIQPFPSTPKEPK